MKFIIEHMSNDITEWENIEYQNIATRVGKDNLLITSLTQNAKETLTQTIHDNCILLSENVLETDIHFKKIVLLDPKAEKPLHSSDKDNFEYFLFGGILGDFPSKDRTGELRIMGFETRHLGPRQLPTDHAVIFSQIILGGVDLEAIPFVDDPSFSFNKNESVTLEGFRVYANGAPLKPIMAPGLKELLRKQNDEPFEF